jgi:hypothetical protein
MRSGAAFKPVLKSILALRKKGNDTVSEKKIALLE